MSQGRRLKVGSKSWRIIHINRNNQNIRNSLKNKEQRQKSFGYVCRPWRNRVCEVMRRDIEEKIWRLMIVCCQTVWFVSCWYPGSFPEWCRKTKNIQLEAVLWVKMSHRRMAWLVWGDLKVNVTQIITLYIHGELKSISNLNLRWTIITHELVSGSHQEQD